MTGEVAQGIFWFFLIPFKSYSSGFSSPACMHAKSLQSCPTLCNPMDLGLPDSSVHGTLQEEYWSGLPCPPPGDLPNSGIKPSSLMSPALPGRFFTASTAWEAQALLIPFFYLRILCAIFPKLLMSSFLIPYK